MNLFRSLSSTIRTTVLRFYLLNKCVNDKRGLKFPSRCLEQKFERDRNKSRFKLEQFLRNQKSYCSKIFFKILFARRQEIFHIPSETCHTLRFLEIFHFYDKSRTPQRFGSGKKFPTHLEYFVLMQVHCVQESIIPFYAKGESCILNRVSFMSIVKF